MEDHLKEYINQQLIGRGSFGAVYRATKEGTEYAIKVIRVDTLKPEAQKRLDAEIKAIRKVQHPNVVKLHEHGSYVDNAFEYVYIVMGLVPGKTLAHFVGEASEEEAKRILKSVLSTLDSVHKNSVIHRDLKPDNIMIRSDGTPVILDLGLAKLVDYTSITQTGEVLGTYQYMSPEQISDSKNIDERSDYFSLGVIMYELVTGVSPYDATNLPELVNQVTSRVPKNPTLINSDLSNSFENAILKMLEKDPHRRYQTAKDITSAIDGEQVIAERKLDISPRFYLRMNHNDRGLVQESHTDGIVERVIYPASYFKRNHPTVESLRKLPGLVFATDPGTNRLTYSSFSKTKGVLGLPYSSGSAVSPLSVDDFYSLNQIQDFVKKVLDYQKENGVDELGAPFFYARTPDDPWYEMNIKLTHESIAYRNSNYPDLPIWTGLCMNVDGWHQKKEKSRILNDYVRMETDGYMVYGDPISKTSNLPQMYHYSDLLLTLQSSSGAPVIASRVNGIGLVLIAFGLSGMSAGAASLDNFNENILSSTGEGYTNDPRYYVPGLLSMIALPESADTKIQAIQSTSLADALRCDCRYCESINSGQVIHADIKKHYLHQRKAEIDEVAALDEAARREWITQKIEQAITYKATLGRERVRLGDMPELDTLRGLIAELKKR